MKRGSRKKSQPARPTDPRTGTPKRLPPEADQQFRVMFKYADVGIALSSLEHRYLRVNDKFAALLGYRPDEMTDLGIADVYPENEVAAVLGRREQLARGDFEYASRDALLLRKDGTSVIASFVTSIIRNRDGEPLYFLSIALDKSEARRTAAALEETKELFQQLAKHIPQIFWVADGPLGKMIYVSSACEQILGVSPETLLRKQRLLVRAIHPDDRRLVYEQRKRATAGIYDQTYRVVRSDGATRWVHDRAFPIRDAAGFPVRVAGVTEDITERRRAEEQLIHLAHFDQLTGLPNRTLFADRLQQALALAKRKHWSVAVLFVDIDRFKYVNDSLGHASGDLLLRLVAQRLTRCTRANDTVARFGGDEYAIVVNGLEAADEAALIALKIMEVLNVGFPLEHTELYVSASIGITVAPQDGSTPETLLKQADIAMYRAKELGRKNFQFYKPEMNARAQELLALEQDLRHALERSELEIYYQPKVSLQSGRVTGAEALLRWNHPERGLVSPAAFMPALEETGLIIPVGEFVLATACRQARAWQVVGLSVPIAVNLSARQFVSPAIGTVIQETLLQHHLSPNLLELEITESSVMVDPEEAARTLQRLDRLGVAISIDDFGTGYSSLAYLKRFPIKTLKVDRSFIRDAPINRDDAAITRAIVSMAHSLSLRVIAEGVETKEQLHFLRECTCDEGQGYLFSRPLPAKDAEAVLRRADLVP